ncbi:MAG: dipeptidase PepE [Acidobacteriota bacterium]
MQLLLLSNSRTPDGGFLTHAAEQIHRLFDGTTRLLFIPFALHDHEEYTRVVRERFASCGLAVEKLAAGPAASDAIEEAEALFVGGGNTFRLLEAIQRFHLIEPIRRRARAGMPYLGSSAGTVMAGPTIRTTNDMPIIQPASFKALGLVPFQINCHYLEPDPRSRHMGETRDQRITEFLEEDPTQVIGLREGAMLEVSGGPGAPLEVRLAGTAGARVFRRGLRPTEHAPGGLLDLPAV